MPVLRKTNYSKDYCYYWRKQVNLRQLLTFYANYHLFHKADIIWEVWIIDEI